MYCIKIKSKFIIALTVLIIMSTTNIYATKQNIQTNIFSLIPVRETFEKLGFQVIWSQENQTVKITSEDIEILLTTNKDKLDIKNKIYDMKILDGLAYINADYINNIGFIYKHINTHTIEISKQVNIGDKAPTIKTKTLKEEDLKLLNENNKTKLLFFWATWCPYCTEYIKEINKISTNDSFNFEIIAINIDEKDNKQNVEKFIENNLLNAKNILDFDKEIFHYYGSSAIPMTYIIDTNGIIFDLIIGPISKDEIINRINTN